MVNGVQGTSSQRSYSRPGQTNDIHEQSSLNECLSITSSTNLTPSQGFLHSPTWSSNWHSFGHSDSSDWLSQSIGSSTTSWSDELEGETSKKLGEQLERLENTLYNDFPERQLQSSKLVDECCQWRRFPHLRIVGVRMSVGCQTRSAKEDIEEEVEEIIAKHKSGSKEQTIDDFTKNVDEDVCMNKEQEILKEKIKRAVIDQIFSRIWPGVVKKIEPVYKELSRNQNVCDKLTQQQKTQKIQLGSVGGDSELINKLSNLSVDNSLSLSSLRTKSGRQRNLTSVFPVKSLVIECSFPTQCYMSNVRNKSAIQRSEKLSQDRHLSPLQNTDFKRSADVRKKKNGFVDRRLDLKDKVKSLPDSKVGKLLCQDESRTGLRRNLKTSPPAQWNRHITLPPIESNDIVPKVLDENSKRSTSAMMKIGKPDVNSRPNTSKNQIILDPNLMVCSTKMELSKQWLVDRPNNNALNRSRWKSRGNTFRK